jgi:ethanolamine ammonia-lyase large subunit
LQFILAKATEDGLLSPLQDRTARIGLSLYADDVVVFINPVKGEVDALMQIMHKFREATGLRINIQKSEVLPIICSQLNLDEVL